jgi:predicted N-formylglutamate amidohydrolase
MRADLDDSHSAQFAPIIENAGAPSPVLLVCEHASNAMPAPWGDLGLPEGARAAHIAWDIGALGLARELSRALDATLIHAPVSRLIYDLNRAPDLPSAMPARSEVFDIAGNAAITPAQRTARTKAVYLPWVAGLHGLIATRIATGPRPIVITIHSFTPVYHGAQRSVEFGIIHDADPSLACTIFDAAAQTGLNTQLNAPYSAADDVTHTLRLFATPYGLQNAMLEIRNDLIASPAAQSAMAARLAPVLQSALSAKDLAA